MSQGGVVIIMADNETSLQENWLASLRALYIPRWKQHDEDHSAVC